MASRNEVLNEARVKAADAKGLAKALRGSSNDEDVIQLAEAIEALAEAIDTVAQNV